MAHTKTVAYIYHVRVGRFAKLGLYRQGYAVRADFWEEAVTATSPPTGKAVETKQQGQERIIIYGKECLSPRQISPSRKYNFIVKST